MTGFGGTPNKKGKKSPKRPQINFKKWFNQAIYSHQTGRLREAESIYKKMIAAGTTDPAVFCNLGILCKNSGRIEEALEYYGQALGFEPNDPHIYSNIGNLYREIGKLDKALQFTLKSLDLDHWSSTVQMNLGSIYRDLGETDGALTATIKAIEVDQDNIEALHNLKSLANDIKINASNRDHALRAYEILLNQNDVSHRKLCSLFIQEYLDKIKSAANSDPIISDHNRDFHELAADWRFRKSLILLIPPHQAVEEFLTRLRKEFLIKIENNDVITQNSKYLLEALATQCFLNEYIYWQSAEEEAWVNALIERTRKSPKVLNQCLPIIGCYKAIYAINLASEDLERYPTDSDESIAFINTQYKDLEKENAIKSRLIRSQATADKVSLEVQKMYEENPYPRYQCADYTHPSLAKPIHTFISLETTIASEKLPTDCCPANLIPKILIAGCGTGNQIINASRYKNALITAIDISKNSLAYAARKCEEYKMRNVDLRQLNILDANKLSDLYDVIECCGVLHHMEDPAKGLAALNSKLKPGGYIKIGLYSKQARKKISEAREMIRKNDIPSTPEGIREFRKQVFNEDQNTLKSISIAANDFYSLSECRDLCFHVQEHQFTTEWLQKLLEDAGLVFCGFMQTESIRATYKQQFPEDNDGTSLNSWGKFEEHEHSTFQSMYQFWAHKPS